MQEMNLIEQDQPVQRPEMPRPSWFKQAKLDDQSENREHNKVGPVTKLLWIKLRGVPKQADQDHRQDGI